MLRMRLRAWCYKLRNVVAAGSLLRYLDFVTIYLKLIMQAFSLACPYFINIESILNSALIHT